MSLVPSQDSDSSAQVSPCITVWCPGAGTSRRIPALMMVPPCTSSALAPTSTVSRRASPYTRSAICASVSPGLTMWVKAERARPAPAAGPRPRRGRWQHASSASPSRRSARARRRRPFGATSPTSMTTSMVRVSPDAMTSVALLDRRARVHERHVVGAGRQRDAARERRDVDALTIDPHLGPRRGQDPKGARRGGQELEWTRARGLPLAVRGGLQRRSRRRRRRSPSDGQARDGAADRRPGPLAGRGLARALARGDEARVLERAHDELLAAKAGPGVGELLELLGERLGGLEAVGRELLDGAHDDALEGERHVGGAAVQRDGRIAPDAVRARAPVALVAALEGPRAAEQLVEDDAQGEDVAAGVHRLAQDLLGGHVRGRPERRHVLEALRGRAHRLVGGALGDAEVEDLHVAALADQDVGGLDVAVHDAALVGVGEAPRDRRADGGDAVGRRRRASCAAAPRGSSRRRTRAPGAACAASSRRRAAVRCSGGTARPARAPRARAGRRTATSARWCSSGP